MVQPLILDVGCGDNKYPNSVGMDKRELAWVDFVHDVEQTPWPVVGISFDKIRMSHILEHIKPWIVINVINEAWYCLKEDGLLEIIMPVAGSTAFYSDPTHIKSWNIHTVNYFDINNNFWNVYKPKPWKILKNEVNKKEYLEIIMQKVLNDK